MIRTMNDLYVLDTKNTTYAFAVMPTGQLEHLYYGRKIRIDDADALREKHTFGPGNTIAYINDHGEYTLEDVRLETSAYGKGDIREPMVEVVCADGSSSLDFVFEEAHKEVGKDEMKTLPSSYDESNQVEHLTIVMKDKNEGFTLELHYYVYEEEDVITRRARFINSSDKNVDLKRLLSYQIDMDRSGYVVTTFHGGWTKEMNKKDVTVTAGKFVNASYTGTTSSRANNFFMVSAPDATETTGECYGFNLMYSGNHYEAVEISSFDKTRICAGINPTNFSFTLAPQEDFEAPEAVMTYSKDGHTGMSHNMHAFVREHVVRGEWKYRERPVLLNSWEANYFDIDEGKLVKLAKEGKDVGIELFVMDDGWFGERSDDKRALGDWTPNTKKLPRGLDGLAKKINELGLEFGIWVEPEMINVDSELYHAHPDWAMAIPNKEHSEGRNQRVLDLCNPEVVDYMIEQMSNVFSSANIAYVKWDMNRIFSDYYSPYLDASRQQEVAHRYVIGLYRMMKTLTERFPKILFEGCAAGGNRFDLGILSYFPQIWGSDNTDAVCRLNIQNGYSYGYPMSTVTAHVSACPNHQTLRTTPLDSRYAVAVYGVLGYECNLCDMKKEELETIKAQIAVYKQWRQTLQYGDFYRGRSGNIYEWTTTSQDQKQSVGMMMQREVQPNEMYQVYHGKGLKEDSKYHFYGRELKYNIKGFGDLVNTVAPIHIKQDSVIHNTLAKFIKMDGETEDCNCYGDALMYAGVKLKQSFVGTGYNDQIRYFPDYAARLYFMEEMEGGADNTSVVSQIEQSVTVKTNSVVAEESVETKTDATVVEDYKEV